MVVIRGMNVYPSAIEEAVRQVSDSGEFRITFYTEPQRHGRGQARGRARPTARARGASRRVMRQQLGLRVRVVPVAPGVLPRDTTASLDAWWTSELRGGSHRERPAGGLAIPPRPQPPDPRRERAGRRADPALHAGRGPRPGRLPRPRGGSRGRVRRQPSDSARGAEAALQRQPDPRDEGPGRRHLRRPHRRAGDEPQPERRDRDDARDGAVSLARAARCPRCCSRSRWPAWPPTSPTTRP